MYWKKVIPTKEDKDNPNWDNHFYEAFGEVRHTAKCDHYWSGFGTHCTCGAIDKAIKEQKK